jgi:hypothetical protein
MGATSAIAVAPPNTDPDSISTLWSAIVEQRALETLRSF